MKIVLTTILIKNGKNIKTTIKETKQQLMEKGEGMVRWEMQICNIKNN